MTTDRDSDNAAVARLGSGDFFGEIAILLDVPRTANIRSITPLKVLVLNRSDFLDACNKYPQLAAHFKSMADKAYQMYKAQVNYIMTESFAIYISLNIFFVQGCKDNNLHSKAAARYNHR